jgi:hypothetical protein
MDGFEDITLSFDGADYTIEANRVWELLLQLENVMGYDYLIQKLAVNDVPAMHVYQAFAIALRFAGHKKVTPQMIMKGVSKKQLFELAIILAGILRLTQPPDDMESIGGQEPSDKEAQDVKKKD